MNFQLSLEKKINKFGQKAKILGKSENAHEIRKKGPVYVRTWTIFLRYSTFSKLIKDSLKIRDICRLRDLEITDLKLKFLKNRGKTQDY